MVDNQFLFARRRSWRFVPSGTGADIDDRRSGDYATDHAERVFPACVVQQRIVIDPQTGQPLSQELRCVELPVGQTWSEPGGLFSYELFGPGHQ